MSYCIYLRKSRKDEELDELETLSRHEETLLALAKKQNLSITKIYREVVSGDTISSRPEMQNMLRDISNNLYAGVLIVEIERLARGNTIDQGIVAETFKESGAKIITPLKVFDPNDEYDEEYFEFGLFMARREYKTINRRIQRGRLASVQEGKFIASTPPFGYDKIKIKDDKGYTLKANKNSSIINMIFDLYVNEKKGMESIAKHLDSLYIKPLYAKNWSRSSIKDIISNPTYIGKIRWGYKKENRKDKTRNVAKDYILVDGLHKPIIDDNTFFKAQDILKNKGIYPVVSNKELKNPFTGLIYCEKCNVKLTRVFSNTKTGYYVLKCPNRHCDNISSPIYLIEFSMLEILKKWVINTNLIFDLGDKSNSKINFDFSQQLLSVNNDINKTNEQIEELHNLLEQKVYTVDMFLERNNKLNNNLLELNTLKTNLLIEEEKFINSEKIKEEFIPKIKKIIEIYDTVESAKFKNDMLKEIIEKIEYSRDCVTTKNKRDSAVFKLTVYPKLTKY